MTFAAFPWQSGTQGHRSTSYTFSVRLLFPLTCPFPQLPSHSLILELGRTALALKRQHIPLCFCTGCSSLGFMMQETLHCAACYQCLLPFFLWLCIKFIGDLLKNEALLFCQSLNSPSFLFSCLFDRGLPCHMPAAIVQCFVFICMFICLTLSQN